MPRWVLVSALLAGMSAFAGGALVGAHAKAGASAPGLARRTASSHPVQPQPAARPCHARGSGVCSLPDPGAYNQPLRRKKTAKPATDATRSPSPKT